MKRAISQLKNQKGSLSVEASISLLVFSLALSSLLLILSDLSFKEQMNHLLYKTSSQISLVDVQTDGECHAVASSLLVKYLVEPDRKLKLEKTTLREDGTFTLTLSWHQVLPIGGDYRQSSRITSRLITRGFDGRSNNDERTVYVTNMGKKYHLKTCYHLAKSSNPIKRKEAISRGYEPCWHCVGGLEPFEKAPGRLGR